MGAIIGGRFDRLSMAAVTFKKMVSLFGRQIPWRKGRGL